MDALSREHPASRTPGAPSARRLARTAAGLEDATLAAYLAELHDRGRAPASASPAGGRGLLPGPASPATAAAVSRGRSGRQTWPPASHLPPAAASSPTSSPLGRGRLDAVIAGLLFHGRDAPEVSALRGADAADGDGIPTRTGGSRVSRPATATWTGSAFPTTR